MEGSASVSAHVAGADINHLTASNVVATATLPRVGGPGLGVNLGAVACSQQTHLAATTLARNVTLAPIRNAIEGVKQAVESAVRQVQHMGETGCVPGRICPR